MIWGTHVSHDWLTGTPGRSVHCFVKLLSFELDYSSLFNSLLFIFPSRGSAFRGLTFLIREQSVGWRLGVNDDPISVRSRCLWRATFSLLHRKTRPIRQDLSIVWVFLDEGKQNETKWVMWVLSEKVASLWNIYTFCQKGLMQLVCLFDLSF